MRPLLVLVLTVSLGLAAAGPAHAYSFTDPPRAWGAPVALDSSSGGDATKVAVTGVTTLAWLAGTGADRHAFGVAQSRMALTDFGPAATVDVAGSTFETVFTWTTGGSENRGFARLYSSGNASADVALGPIDAGAPLLAVNEWGDAVVAWTAGGHVRALHRGPFERDPAFSGPFDLGPGRPVAVGGGINDSSVVAYAAADGSLRAARVGRSGVNQDAAIPGGVTDAVAPQIAVGDEGSALLAFRDVASGTASGRPVRVVRGATDGSWQLDPAVSGDADGDVTVTSGSGRPVVAWTAPSGDLRVAESHTRDFAFGPPKTLATGVAGPPILDESLSAHALITYRAGGVVRTIRRDNDEPWQAPLDVTCPGDDAAVLGAGLSGPSAGVVVLDKTAAVPALREVGDAKADGPAPVSCGDTAQQDTRSATGQVTPPAPLARPAAPRLAPVKGQRLKTVLRKGLAVTVQVPAPGTADVVLATTRAETKRLKLGRKARTVGVKRNAKLAAGTTTVRVKLAKDVVRTLKRRKAKRLALQLRVTSRAGGLLVAGKTTLKR